MQAQTGLIREEDDYRTSSVVLCLGWLRSVIGHIVLGHPEVRLSPR